MSELGYPSDQFLLLSFQIERKGNVNEFFPPSVLIDSVAIERGFFPPFFFFSSIYIFFFFQFFFYNYDIFHFFVCCLLLASVWLLLSVRLIAFVSR